MTTKQALEQIMSGEKPLIFADTSKPFKFLSHYNFKTISEINYFIGKQIYLLDYSVEPELLYFLNSIISKN